MILETWNNLKTDWPTDYTPYLQIPKRRSARQVCAAHFEKRPSQTSSFTNHWSPHHRCETPNLLRYVGIHSDTAEHTEDLSVISNYVPFGKLCWGFFFCLSVVRLQLCTLTQLLWLFAGRIGVSVISTLLCTGQKSSGLQQLKGSRAFCWSHAGKIMHIYVISSLRTPLLNVYGSNLYKRVRVVIVRLELMRWQIHCQWVALNLNLFIGVFQDSVYNIWL